MPPLGVVTGGMDFSNVFIALNGEHYDSLAVARHAGAPTMNIGVFMIVAFVLFMAIKAMNQFRRKQGEEPQTEPPPSREVASRGNPGRADQALGVPAAPAVHQSEKNGFCAKWARGRSDISDEAFAQNISSISIP